MLIPTPTSELVVTSRHMVAAPQSDQGGVTSWDRLKAIKTGVP